MDTKAIVIYICVFAVQLNVINCVSFAPVVTTKNGQLRGVVKTLDDGSEVNLYLSVPYGKPMLGNQRFRKPEAVSHWDGVYNATQIRNACPQPYSAFDPFDPAPQSEDCLFLSVWNPAKPLAEGKKRSVMFFIHGGAFESGSMYVSGYDGRYIANIGDVIVVTINYRLGPFGFLYGGTDDTPGNVGLHDQILALKWTHDNIEAFGGDPASITIFGESAGSMSVGSLVVSPLANGLFKRAIMQSGGPQSYLGGNTKEEALKKTKDLANSLHCNKATNAETIACLRNKTTAEILNVTKSAIANGDAFEPLYGDDLMPTLPIAAIKAGKYNKVDLLYGTVRDEGSYFVVEALKDLAPEKHPKLSLTYANIYIQLIFAVFDVRNSTAISQLYLKDLKENDTDAILKAVASSLGDYLLTCPTVLFGAAVARADNASKAYAYKMTHELAIHALLDCGGWMGVCHGDDVLALFGIPITLRGIKFTEADYKLSMDMIHIWTTFAKTGTPPDLNNAKWVEAVDRNVTNASVRYMELNPTNYRIVSGEYKNTCEGFWSNILS